MLSKRLIRYLKHQNLPRVGRFWFTLAQRNTPLPNLPQVANARNLGKAYGDFICKEDLMASKKRESSNYKETLIPSYLIADCLIDGLTDEQLH